MALGEKLFFILTGIRLHGKEFWLRVTGKFNTYDYCLAFPTIPEGLRAEKYLKGLNAISIPIPNEIFEGCGVGILVTENDLDKLMERFEKEGIHISGIFKREGKTFKEVKR
ncbi:Protein of unknown function [Desulfurobacterium pacificum]|jgi:hypothetical protein|uniref:Putative Se/S carrier protein-like domain-containing protein n=1 Tax=Desulfurobacterium pacificum TaxID=240166 RepID=A0ABY1NDM5_9BACT|nr:DUF3343 domain-containing protein [Desulfurobacterium pacificum]SMP07113.1 Protein of unknown function [Desulfurobacterium pacificum]